MMHKIDWVNFFTKKLGQLKIAVVGDVMLDRYYYGEVSRISPEAPVPVTKVLSESSNLGGAGNVATNLALLGTKVYLAGLVGRDDNAGKFSDLLDSFGIDSSGLVISDNRRTTTKLRVIGSSQQMLRLDFEEPLSLTLAEEQQLKDWFLGLLKKGLDGLVISDYAKGLCSLAFCHWLIDIANEHKIPVLVDPKGYEWEKYQGADFVTPNVKEMGEAVKTSLVNKTEPVIVAARDSLSRYGIKSVLVTRSEKGLSYVSQQETFTVPAAAREVYDVSGAGDTVAAVFLAAVAGGLSCTDAAVLANEAAGIVVGRVGTYAIRRDELLTCLLEKEYQQEKTYRPLSWQEIDVLATGWRKQGEKIVFTNGCFDLLHSGHIAYLEKAATLGHRLIIGLNTDDSVRRLKGQTRPLVGELDRARVLSALACVDMVILFAEDTPEKLIELIRPDVLVKGGDYQAEDVAGRQFAGEVKIVDFEEGYSTTGVVEKIVRLVKEGKL